MSKIKDKLTSLSLLIILSSLFFFVFYTTNIKKGTFHTDEPGIVLSGFTKGRSILQIQAEARNQAQPPLEYVIREKLYRPIGELTGLTTRFPELYQRGLSLLWWTIPLLYFALYRREYSKNNARAIIISFLFVVSSDFITFYIAEAKHYSAIAAMFFTLIIILLTDKRKVRFWYKRFIFFSLFIPLLHIVSMFYYIPLLVLFMYYLKKDLKGESFKYKRVLLFYFLFFTFIGILYWNIKKGSEYWQHPSFINVLNFGYFSSYIKWVLDWVFYTTPLYIIYKNLPQLFKEYLFFELIIYFLIIMIFVYKKWGKRFPKNIDNAIPPVLIANVFLIWPMSILIVFYQSSMFAGERYSIAIAISIYFLLSILISKFRNINFQYLIMIILTMITIGNNYKYIYKTTASAEEIFVRDNWKLLNDTNSILMLDNGFYSPSIVPLAISMKIPLEIKQYECRYGFFLDNNTNKFNDWIANSTKDVYLLTSGKNITGDVKIVWEYKHLKLYFVNYINEEHLCTSVSNRDNCYVRCTKGNDPLPNGRVIPWTAPHMDAKPE